jgi:hypothetical protein
MSIMPIAGKLGPKSSFKISVRRDGFVEITQEKPGCGMIVLHCSEAQMFVDTVLEFAEKAKVRAKGR